MKVNLLKSQVNIGMSTNDIKLLYELKDKSNKLFHNNEQSLAEAVERLNNLFPDNVNKYQASLLKLLKQLILGANNAKYIENLNLFFIDCYRYS